MRYSVGSGLGPGCNSRYIRTCCDTAAAMPWRTRATTHGRYRPGSGTRTFSTRCATPSWHRIASRTFGECDDGSYAARRLGAVKSAKRVRAGLTRVRDEGKRPGRSPIAPGLEKRIRDALTTP